MALQDMVYRLIDSFDFYIGQSDLVIDFCNPTRLFGQVAGKLLKSFVGQLHVPQDGGVLFGDRLIGWVFFEKTIYHFWVWKQ